MADPASIVQVKDFFGYDNIGEFRKQWNELTEQDKAQIREGIGNGSLTY